MLLEIINSITKVWDCSPKTKVRTPFSAEAETVWVACYCAKCSKNSVFLAALLSLTKDWWTLRLCADTNCRIKSVTETLEIEREAMTVGCSNTIGFNVNGVLRGSVKCPWAELNSSGPSNNSLKHAPIQIIESSSRHGHVTLANLC